MTRDDMQRRVRGSEFKTRDEDGKLYIEGYFAVFNSLYEMWPGASESIAPGAFSGTLDGDIRALINHDPMYVLGRTKAGTLELREDEKGLWGRIEVNRNDSDAMNAYERVARGDVDQCSFGFAITKESVEHREDGSVHWTIEEVELYEVSVCTFPAYEDTSVSARQKEYDTIKERRAEAWREKARKRLKGE